MCFLKKLRGIVAYGIGGASENLDLGSRYGRRKVESRTRQEKKG